MFTLLVDHANRSLSQLRGILWLFVHGSIFSKVGASAKPGAVQTDYANEDSGGDWQANVHRGQEAFLRALAQHFGYLN